jgi:hypothetical protein
MILFALTFFVGFRPLQKMISIIQSRYRHILPSSKSCSNYVTTSIIENGNKFCSRTRKMEILFCIGLTSCFTEKELIVEEPKKISEDSRWCEGLIGDFNKEIGTVPSLNQYIDLLGQRLVSKLFFTQYTYRFRILNSEKIDKIRARESSKKRAVLESLLLLHSSREYEEYADEDGVKLVMHAGYPGEEYVVNYFVV